MIEPHALPRLRRGVVLRYDRVRERDVLLYPEGVLVLNTTAADIVRRCDGDTSVVEITFALRERYRGVQDADVADVLARLAERGMIEVPIHD
ncbi:MAG TPA: pyrroloquinoline quinone biosynthesis peptide chaperone PqqD [Pseudonocardiaceae bacterium]|nr:pyrroloquinoline quinone biosynthesis peptide chaperone PqqD [Pseudonocardiaceae bacterium]